MSEKRFVKDHSYLVNYDKYCILDKVQHKHLYLDEVCKKLNEQQATIEMYRRRVDKREEQISIIKKHCLKFLTDEQVETIRKELED